MTREDIKHNHQIQKEDGFSLVELVIAIGVTLVLTITGVVSYSSFSGSTKQAVAQSAASEVYTKAYSALIDGDPKTEPETAAAEYNASSKNISTEVDKLSSDRIRVTVTLDEYSAVKETPVGGTEDNSPIDQPTDGIGGVISSNTHKTVMNFQCDSTVNGLLPIINSPEGSKVTLVNMGTNEETVLENVENSTEYYTVDDSFVPQTILSSVKMEADVKYQLTVEAEVDSTTSLFNPETSFAIMSLLGESYTGIIGCLTSVDSIGKGIAGISTIEEYKLESVPSTIPSTVTSLHGAFYGAKAFNQDISSWDVSNVTSMSGMFVGAEAFDQDISDWNVSNVENMSGMFSYAYSFNNGGNPLDWGEKTAKVKNMNFMFGHAEAFNQDISSWNVSNVKDMHKMFFYAHAFNNGNQPLDWGEKTAKVENMSEMFLNAYAFNQDISSWDVSNVTNMNDMFAGAEAFNQDISSWKVSKIADPSPGFATDSGIESNKQYHPQWGVA